MKTIKDRIKAEDKELEEKIKETLAIKKAEMRELLGEEEWLKFEERGKKIGKKIQAEMKTYGELTKIIKKLVDKHSFGTIFMALEEACYSKLENLIYDLEKKHNIPITNIKALRKALSGSEVEYWKAVSKKMNELILVEAKQYKKIREELTGKEKKICQM